MQNIYTIFIKNSAYFKNKQFIYLQIKNSVSMLQTHSMWLYYNLLVGRDFLISCEIVYLPCNSKKWNCYIDAINCGMKHEE